MLHELTEQLTIAKGCVAAVVFVLLLLIETWFCRFRRFDSLKDRLQHGVRNLLVGATQIAVSWVLFFPLWQWFAAWSLQRSFGVLYWLELPPVSRAVVAVITLDLAAYLWHVANHRIPFFWRFHRVHHSDLTMDVTTANRFHAGEIFFSGVLRCIIFVIMGLHIYELLIFEIGSVLVVQLHHANIRLPDAFDSGLRWVIPTPDMHKLHHSRIREETNSNYGSVFSIWDRFFGTLRTSNEMEKLSFGLNEFTRPEQQGFLYLLLMPLLSSAKVRKLGLLETPLESAERAEDYAKYRPKYPMKVTIFLKKVCDLRPDHCIADIGSGPGISSRLFLKFGCNVIGVEPNDAVRSAAKKYLAEFDRVRFVDGTAEETTLPSQSVDFVIAAQSFQSFDATAAKREFIRILKPGGWCVLIWNQRPMKEVFAKEYEMILRELLPDYDTKEVRPINELIEGFFEMDQRYEKFRNYHPLNYEGLLGRARSFSGATNLSLDAQNDLNQRLRLLYEKYNEQGRITFEYVTHVYIGRLGTALKD